MMSQLSPRSQVGLIKQRRLGKRGTRTVIGVTIFVTLADTFVDIHGITPADGMTGWIVMAIAVAYLCALQEVAVRIYRPKTNRGRIATRHGIEPGIVDRWQFIRDKVGLKEDARADITRFTADLELQIVHETYATWKKSRGDLQKELSRRINTLISEILEPLAAEIRALNDFNHRTNAILREAQQADSAASFSR